MNEALKRLRQAIISDVSEDCLSIDELDDYHRDVVDAFNAIPGVDPITNSDIGQDDAYDTEDEGEG